MHILSFLNATLFTLLALSSDPTSAKSRPKKAVLLSNVKSLTLHSNSKTSHRRVSAIPQLKCISGNGRGLYEIDVMRCTNQGSDYDAENIQWSCTANLPREFKLGSTDVICEGYDSPNDPYVLKGSCGVEYRLILTDVGEEKYGKGGGKESGLDWGGALILGIFTAMLAFMLYLLWLQHEDPGAGRAPRQGRGFGGGWGGGGGGGGNDPFDPPPPYPGKRSSARGAQGAGQEGWRPGFWTGALGGAAAGYMAGNRGYQQEPPPRQGNSDFGGNNSNNRGTNSMGRSNMGSRSSSGSSGRYESTGFGSTSRR